MKYFIISFVFAVIVISCNDKKQSQNNVNNELIIQNKEQIFIPVILSNSLKSRRKEFEKHVDTARKNIKDFSKKYDWEDLTKEDFMDSVMIFDDKNTFNVTLLTIAGVDTSIQLPDTYCAALESRILLAVSPEFYSKVYPEGIEEKSYEKLLTHEIAHRLHIRILNGNEEAMGPIWFYEGFAMYAANQFSESKITLTKEKMIEIMNNPDRGGYINYNYIFRYFAERIPLKELIFKAKNENFNDELISTLK